jgi:hypothetical protein
VSESRPTSDNQKVHSLLQTFPAPVAKPQGAFADQQHSSDEPFLEAKLPLTMARMTVFRAPITTSRKGEQTWLHNGQHTAPWDRFVRRGFLDAWFSGINEQILRPEMPKTLLGAVANKGHQVVVQRFQWKLPKNQVLASSCSSMFQSSISPQPLCLRLRSSSAPRAWLVCAL